VRVRLNLATKPLETHRKFLAGAGLGAFFAALLFLGLGWHVYSARKAVADLRAKTTKMQEDLVRLEEQRVVLEHFFSQPVNAKLHERAAFLNSLIDARSFNWTQMFMDLEKILPAGVHVVSIEPKQEKGRVQVKLTIGVTSSEAKLKFLKALEDSRSFTNIELTNEHAPSQTASPDQEVLELKAAYSRT
jgi:type IV pilus assembly protein PilN